MSFLSQYLFPITSQHSTGAAWGKVLEMNSMGLQGGSAICQLCVALSKLLNLDVPRLPRL